MSVTEYVAARIRDAVLHTHPFPYIYIDHVFPDDYYRKIREYWPNNDEMIPMLESKRSTANMRKHGMYRERLVVNLDPDSMQDLSEEKREFWNEFCELLSSQDFGMTVMEKFRPYVKQRLNEADDDFFIKTDAMITRDTTNYSLAPHTDTIEKLVTVLFYCPEDDALKKYGTSIYLPKEDGYRSTKGGHALSADRFRLHSTMEFTPNCLFAFFRTDTSFHGVEHLSEDNIERDLVIYNTRLKSRKSGKPGHS